MADRCSDRSMMGESMSDAVILDEARLQDLIDALSSRGYRTIGPVLERSAIVYGPVTQASELPRGYVDEQAGGHYRWHRSRAGGHHERALFRYVVGPHSWKRFLFPPVQRLWRDSRLERIWDGTSEIQRHIITRSILRPLGA